jgi:hypothetical protein
MNTRLIVLGGILAVFFALAAVMRSAIGPKRETVRAVPHAVLEERARSATEHNPYMRKER